MSTHAPFQPDDFLDAPASLQGAKTLAPLFSQAPPPYVPPPPLHEERTAVRRTAAPRPQTGAATAPNRVPLSASGATVIRIDPDAGTRAGPSRGRPSPGLAAALTVLEDDAPPPLAHQNTIQEETYNSEIDGHNLTSRVAERLFDLSADLTEVSAEAACQKGLDLLHEYIPCFNGGVALGTLNDPALRFVAAIGLYSEDLRHQTSPYGQFLLGRCHETGQPVLLDEVDSEDLAAPPESDAQWAVLCVPIHTPDQETVGVIRLLQVDGLPFVEDQVRVVESVAVLLGGTLGG